MTIKHLDGMTVSVSETAEWIYPRDERPPHGAKLFLLTKGGVACEGLWTDDGRFLAWQHMFKRNKEKEVEAKGYDF